MMILPALWSYVGAVTVKVDEDISGVDFRVRRGVATRGGVATRAHNLLELQGHEVTAELSWGVNWLICDAVDAVDVYLDCMQSLTLQCI